MGCLIKNELYKAIRLKKLHLLMLVALAIEITAALLGKYGGIAPGLAINGQNFTLLLLDNLPYLFVIFTAVFMDSWVDEYRSGALKLPMLRPVNRIAFLNAKVISFFVCAAVLMGFTLLSAYAVGWVTFGWGENTGIGGVLLILKSGSVTLLPVLGFGLLVLFIAVLTDNMVITVSGAMGLMLVSQMLLQKVYATRELSTGCCSLIAILWRKSDEKLWFLAPQMGKNIEKFMEFEKAHSVAIGLLEDRLRIPTALNLYLFASVEKATKSKKNLALYVTSSFIIRLPGHSWN